MNKLFVLSLIVAGSLVAGSAHSQVRVDARIGIGAPAPVIYENDYPGYTYYAYPAWHGHYRDRYYYQHYRPRFERDHRAYFQGRRFDHERYEHDGGPRGHYDHGHGNYHDHR